MEQINKKQKPSSDDYSRVTHAAGVLASQACSVSALHIKDGMLRIQFNREVAYYARGIVRDVAEGRKSAEWGLKEIKKEQASLLEQSKNVIKYSIGLTAGGLQTREGLKICSAGPWPCIYGGIMTAHGLNNMYENGINLRDGRSDTQGWVRKSYQYISKKFGYSDFEGNMAYAGVDVLMSLHGATKLTLQPGAWRLFDYIRTDYIRAYKLAAPTNLVIDAASDSVTAYGALEEWKARSE